MCNVSCEKQQQDLCETFPPNLYGTHLSSCCLNQNSSQKSEVCRTMFVLFISEICWSFLYKSRHSFLSVFLKSEVKCMYICNTAVSATAVLIPSVRGKPFTLTMYPTPEKFKNANWPIYPWSPTDVPPPLFLHTLPDILAWNWNF